MTDTRAGEWVPQVPLAERVKAVEPDVRDAIVAAERQRIKAAVEGLDDCPMANLCSMHRHHVNAEEILDIIDEEAT